MRKLLPFCSKNWYVVLNANVYDYTTSIQKIRQISENSLSLFKFPLCKIENYAPEKFST